ncbi:glycosyltransferase family 2 protein [Paenibacillus herberti]|uniref:Glycosyltransferase n=1 Tax=Paenibacillus herberti TaxID=1619309 RepID=A0A229NW94_9BACL|nr:glycosyltransferase family 2 protein [Paenibacillus herberti]OXM14213.1 glycosyltransferase [Paenibacillus herberti]
MDSPMVSIVAPMYNEGSNIYFFYERMTSVLGKLNLNYEIVCVNDGSKDDTWERLKEIADRDARVKAIDLSRNFGKEVAMTAGIDFCMGDVIIPIDADLQDPPELIPTMIDKWREGYDVVYATRIRREGETRMKKLTAHLFYRTIRKMTNIDIPADTGDFRLMSRPVVDALKQLKEQHRFMKGLFSWVGFKQTSIPYLRDPRHSGKSSFNFWKLWNFAIEGITSFTFAPLQLFTYFGVTVSFASFIYAIYMIISTFLYGNPVPGYPSLMVAILFFSGVQLMTLGIIGEYIGRIYNESKRRPLYLTREVVGAVEEKQSVEYPQRLRKI